MGRRNRLLIQIAYVAAGTLVNDYLGYAGLIGFVIGAVVVLVSGILTTWWANGAGKPMTPAKVVALPSMFIIPAGSIIITFYHLGPLGLIGFIIGATLAMADGTISLLLATRRSRP